MKPVVSSIVALAIAIAPAFAIAAEKAPNKPVAVKVVHHSKKSGHKHAGVIRVKHDGKKAVLVRASHATPAAETESKDKDVSKDKNVHKEIKVDGHGGAVIPATLSQKSSHGKLTKVSAKTSADLPKLPTAAQKSKGGSEKGARKATEKKNESAGKDGEEPKRDGDFAELVARIRGTAENEEDTSEPKTERPIEKKAKVSSKTCTKDPVEIFRGAEIERFDLASCDGSIAPLAVEHLSILVRPGSADRPVKPVSELAKKKGPEIARGIHRVDPRLVSRLDAIVAHFSKGDRKENVPLKLAVVSGVRPTSVGSLHATGRAIDFRIEGVKNEDVVKFCKTLDDTGCGFYPNSSFVHVDVRDAGAGHVSWIDASGPGESPRYVASWPLPEPEAKRDGVENASAKHPVKIDCELPPEPVDEHPAEVTP